MFDVEKYLRMADHCASMPNMPEDKSKPISPRVAALLEKEAVRGMTTLAYYDHFQQKP
jgi:hypothetical protein